MNIEIENTKTWRKYKKTTECRKRKCAHIDRESVRKQMNLDRKNIQNQGEKVP